MQKTMLLPGLQEVLIPEDSFVQAEFKTTDILLKEVN